jgi:hypothetical protein
MKTPALIAAVERDLVVLGHAAVIQIISTGEALMERRLAQIPTEEWGDVQVDITPREYVLYYLLLHQFGGRQVGKIVPTYVIDRNDRHSPSPAPSNGKNPPTLR